MHFDKIYLIFEHFERRIKLKKFLNLHVYICNFFEYVRINKQWDNLSTNFRK
jgi:hypothetical protein